MRDPHSHGFFRFFAWEAILALILINIDYWFVDPLNGNQIIAWLLLLASLYMIIQGVKFLRKGDSDESRDDPALLDLEKTSQLVTTGDYRYIADKNVYPTFVLKAVSPGLIYDRVMK